MTPPSHHPPGLAGRVAHAFIDSPLTPLIILASVLMGVAAIILLPREEEPQIKVPMIDVMVAMPGFSAEEVEQRATRPIEQLLWEIPGVEYIYSISRPAESLVIVRFKVGEDAERSLVKLNQKLQSNFDRIPPGVSPPLIKPKSIDDVPILALTLHSEHYDHFTLRRLAAEMEGAVKQVPLVAETTLIGGAPRQVRVLLDPVALASRNLSPTALAPRLQAANRQFRAGALTTDNREVLVETGAFLTSAEDVGNVVAGVFGGKPVYLRDVAEIIDGPRELQNYVLFGYGAAGEQDPKTCRPRSAVTLTIAKRPGANAIAVSNEVLRKVDTLKGTLIPSDVRVSITRHYGETAAEKSNTLLLKMAIAVASVWLLIWLSLGWRESGIVLLAIPSTLALTLLVFYLYGYTLNRITLFALIFSIGILVDDAIVVVENVVRHFRLPQNHGRDRFKVAVEAVSEVGNPTILATFAVIAAVLPMAFVGGLMGPYMRPIPIGAGAAMIFSLAVAFIVIPWAAVRLLKPESRNNTDASAPFHASASGSRPSDLTTRLYHRLMEPLIAHRAWRYAFLGGITALLLGAMTLVAVGWVKVKMLPFDNKSEFQIILNMPEGSALEHTAQVAAEMADAVRVEPEVSDYQIYVGAAAPFNFNGLVRHYFLREGAHMADLQVNLVAKQARKAQSHDIAKRIRPRVAQIAARHGANVAIAEVPPGPPVLQTLVAEVYGPTDDARLRLARAVKEIFHQTGGVVDVDWYVEADHPTTRFVVDKEKAMLHDISAETIAETLRIAAGGTVADLLHAPREQEDVEIILHLPRAQRNRPETLLALRIRSDHDPRAALVPLRELVRIEETSADKSRHRKNLMPVTYVIGDVAGAIESPVYAILQMNQALKKLDTDRLVDRAASLPAAAGADLRIYNVRQPFTDARPALKWDGEWHITMEVFRDLGLAFAAVLVLIYLLMVGWFRSLIIPLVVMAAIPFSLVGIMPAHGALGAFFTATSMIGFMAGAGIVVRNSIILVDFIQLRLREGMPLAEAVVDAGAVRFRPMLLTTMAVVVAAAVIYFDPIFQGLAIALMAGEVASLFISRMAVPVLYFMASNRQRPRAEETRTGATL